MCEPEVRGKQRFRVETGSPSPVFAIEEIILIALLTSGAGGLEC
jgi:hypothetical protein